MSVDVMNADLRAVREDASEIKGAMSKVADALERLARLEERQSTVTCAIDRAFGAISKIEGRVSELERAQPVQKLTTGWVTSGVWAAGGMLAMLVLKKVGVM